MRAVERMAASAAWRMRGKVLVCIGRRIVTDRIVGWRPPAFVRYIL
jgi:hypothetical protein